MVDAEPLYYPNMQAGPNWHNPIVFFSPIEIKDITLKMKVKTVDTLGIGYLGECIQTAADQGDLEDITPATDDSATVGFMVLDTQDNYDQLGLDKSTDNPVKATDEFAADVYIDVIILIPGLIVAFRLDASEDASVKIMAILYSAGDGEAQLDDGGGAAYTGKIGRSLSQIPVSDNQEWGVMVVAN